MAKPKHKVKEHKKKGLWHKLKNSAFFVLFMIVLASVDVVSFIVWLSSLLSGGLETTDWTALYISAGITAFFGLVFLLAWLSGRMESRPHAAPRTESFK